VSSSDYSRSLLLLLFMVLTVAPLNSLNALWTVRIPADEL
jgi:hypothetical protein